MLGVERYLTYDSSVEFERTENQKLRFQAPVMPISRGLTIYIRGWQTFSGKDKKVNNLGFVGQMVSFAAIQLYCVVS